MINVIVNGEPIPIPILSKNDKIIIETLPGEKDNIANEIPHIKIELANT